MVSNRFVSFLHHIKDHATSRVAWGKPSLTRVKVHAEVYCVRVWGVHVDFGDVVFKHEVYMCM